MTQQTTIQVGCKVNLHLTITGRLENGYHTLETLFYPLPEPSDTLTLQLTEPQGNFELEVGDPELETDSNTIAKSFRAYCAATGYSGGLRVSLDKRIPMGAGLGGGSADAGAVLKFLNNHPDTPTLPLQELIELAAKIGADVPFFLLDGPAWAEGIGEELSELDLDLKGFSLLLLCPLVHVSSAWAYRAWDETEKKQTFQQKNSSGRLTCAESTDKHSPCRRDMFTNSFEQVVFPKHPQLRLLKEKLLITGAGAAVLSGSGASLLGLYRNKEQIQQAYELFRAMDIPAFQHHF